MENEEQDLSPIAEECQTRGGSERPSFFSLKSTSFLLFEIRLANKRYLNGSEQESTRRIILRKRNSTGI